VNLALWRDISIVWLSLFCFIGLAIPLVVLYFAVRGLQAAHNGTARLLQRAQGYSQLMQQQSQKLSQRAVEPVIQAHKEGVRAQTTVQRLWQDLRKS